MPSWIVLLRDSDDPSKATIVAEGVAAADAQAAFLSVVPGGTPVPGEYLMAPLNTAGLTEEQALGLSAAKVQLDFTVTDLGAPELAAERAAP